MSAEFYSLLITRQKIMKTPEPILIAHLFPELMNGLLELLDSLSPEEWDKPTVCVGWSVKDIALHLLGGDIGIISSRRDGFYLPPEKPINGWNDLVEFINYRNDIWIQATRRMSSQIVLELLKLHGGQVNAYFQSVDPYQMGGSVDWASPDPAPVWLDLAREYTERWHHQQQIRDAVGRPGFTEPRFFAPVLDAFIRALPRTFREVSAPEGTLVALTISGDAGGQWFLRREQDQWNLYVDVAEAPIAETIIDQDQAWRLFTRSISPAESGAILRGDQHLAAKILETVSIIT